METLKPFSVRDSVLGTGACSLQQDVQGTRFGFQNILLVKGDQLLWSCQVRDGPGLSPFNRDVVIPEFDQLSIGQEVALVVLQMGTFSNDPGLCMHLELRDIAGTELLLLERRLPSPYADDDMLSCYASWGGYGGVNGSVATFSNLDSRVTHTSDGSVLLSYDQYPYTSTQTPPVPFLTSLDAGGMTVYQQVDLLASLPSQITARIRDGSWA